MLDRDFYHKQARNLSHYIDQAGRPQAGVNMDLPSYLIGTFKLLNDHAYHIKRTHGKMTRKYIKFNDDAQSLFLEIKLPGQENWIKITPSQARKLEDERSDSDLHVIRTSLKRGAESNSNLVPLGSTRSSGAPVTMQPEASLSRSAPSWIPPSRPAPSQGPTRDNGRSS